MAEERKASDLSERPDPNEELVKVFDSEQESEALVVSGLLESAGIDSTVTSTDAAQNIYPGVGGSIVLVREDQADEARRIIAESREETTEIDVSGEQP
jgi:Putative prokaryotic signal transducing protein